MCKGRTLLKTLLLEVTSNTVNGQKVDRFSTWKNNTSHALSGKKPKLTITKTFAESTQAETKLVHRIPCGLSVED